MFGYSSCITAALFFSYKFRLPFANDRVIKTKKQRNPHDVAVSWIHATVSIPCRHCVVRDTEAKTPDPLRRLDYSNVHPLDQCLGKSKVIHPPWA